MPTLIASGTRPRPACRGRARAALPPPDRRSLFERRLRRLVRLRVLRPHRQAGEAEPGQDLADPALVQPDREPRLDQGLEVDPAPAHHAVPGRVGPALHGRRQLGLLLGREARLAPRSGPVAQAGEALNGMDGPRLLHHRARRAGHDTRRPLVAEITTVGLDLAKNWFQVHAADAQGRLVMRKKLARSKVIEFFANLPPCVVGMEACGGAQYWARHLIKLGPEVRLTPPQYVKPYVKTNKHDAADAEAICEAVTRPSMRFVPVKTVEQQTMAQLHRIRQLLVKQRTTHVNALRGHLAELGIVRGQGRGKAGELVRLIE